MQPMRLIALFLALIAAAPALAGEGAPVGYGGKKVQLNPVMAPYHTSIGVRYEVLTLRITFDTGARERPACFAVPLVHDRIIRWLYKANLTSADFAGQRRELLAKNLFDVAINTVGRGYYTALEIVDPEKEDLNPKSTKKDKAAKSAHAVAEGKQKPKGEGESATPGEVDMTLSKQCVG
jgi:hypothetical protein